MTNESDMPKHQQLEQVFRRRIVSGQLRPGERLPSVLKLAQIHDCSPGTIRRMLATLAQDGLVDPRPGSGVYVQEQPRQKIIGFMVPNLTNPDHVGMVDAITHLASERGYSTVCFCRQDPVNLKVDGLVPQHRFIDRMHQLRAAGIIACPTSPPHEAILHSRMRALNMPHVIVNDYWGDNPESQQVSVDQAAATRMAVNHLADLGHRHIALWMMSIDQWANVPFAFRDQLRQRGLAYDKAACIVTDPVPCVEQILQSREQNPITAIIVPYYSQAHVIIARLKMHGLRIPKDISIVSLGGPLARLQADLDLTATLTPFERIAARALDGLFQCNDQEVTRMLYKPSLHVGCTTAELHHSQNDTQDNSQAGTASVDPGTTN